jgi:hypothetical protein
VIWCGVERASRIRDVREAAVSDGYASQIIGVRLMCTISRLIWNPPVVLGLICGVVGLLLGGPSLFSAAFGDPKLAYAYESELEDIMSCRDGRYKGLWTKCSGSSIYVAMVYGTCGCDG